ncbi:hypothetical protein, partial [Acidithiobacillus ferriphilus]
QQTQGIPQMANCCEDKSCEIANVGVLLAASSIYLLVLASRWPDIIVGALISGVFLSSALNVLRQSLQALRAPVSSR